MPIAVDFPLSTIPTNGSEWAELIVKEMSSASNLVDAKNRASKILKLLEKCVARVSPDEKRKVNKVLSKVIYCLILKLGLLTISYPCFKAHLN
jgi:hypothetical protein